MGTLTEGDLLFVEKFLDAFKTLGGDEAGLIDYDHFKSKFKESKEVLHQIETENCVDGSNLNFIKLCRTILSTKATFNKLSNENGRIVALNPRINSRTFTRRKASTQALKYENNSNKKIYNLQIKGALYSLNGDFFSNNYQLETLENSEVEISVKPISFSDDCKLLNPIEVLVLHEKNQGFISHSSFLNEEGFCSLKVSLKKGKYMIVPVLLNWKTEDNPIIESEIIQSLLGQNEEGLPTLTPRCIKVLRIIFDSVDLDGNGLLNQLEFDLFIQHTSGETAAEEWSTIEDNFKMEDGQLTFDGFLELYKMVLQTDPADVFNMLQQMGLDNYLKQTNAQGFLLTTSSFSSKVTLKALPVSSYYMATEKNFKKAAVENGSSKKVKNMNDLVLYTHTLPHRVTIVIQNQSHSKVTVQLDCTKSINCQSHRRSLDYSVQVQPRTSIVGHHLFPTNIQQPWNVDCVESLL